MNEVFIVVSRPTITQNVTSRCHICSSLNEMQSWALGTFKATTVSIPIFCKTSNDGTGTDNDTFFKK